MQQALDLLKQRAKSAGFTAVIVLATIQLVLPSLFDAMLTLMIAAIGYGTGRLDQQKKDRG